MHPGGEDCLPALPRSVIVAGAFAVEAWVFVPRELGLRRSNAASDNDRNRLQVLQSTSS
jgi:hypothetical protein